MDTGLQDDDGWLGKEETKWGEFSIEEGIGRLVCNHYAYLDL